MYQEAKCLQQPQPSKVIHRTACSIIRLINDKHTSEPCTEQVY